MVSVFGNQDLGWRDWVMVRGDEGGNSMVNEFSDESDVTNGFGLSL